MEKDKIILAVEDLHVRIGQQMILHEISFSVSPGEIVGIIGPNGCGKTTLLNTISGFLPIETGMISFNGKDIMHLDPYIRARLGVSRGFQHVGVFRDMTVEENLMIAIERAEQLPWWWRFSPGKRAHVSRVIDGVLEDVDLLPHKKSIAGILSGGQLRLLELTRLRLLKGNLLLIDEPTAGVSPILKNKLSDIIRKLVREHGHTAVIVEHDLKFLFDLADRIIVLVDGEKYMEGTPSEIREDERLKKVYFGE